MNYRDLHERAHKGTLVCHLPDGTGRPPSRGRDALTPSEHQLGALERLARIRAMLGSAAIGLVEAIVVLDLSWCELARRMTVDPKTAKTRGLTALAALAAS